MAIQAAPERPGLLAEKRQATKKYDLVHDIRPQVQEPMHERESLP
jgi:hypothetical protein